MASLEELATRGGQITAAPGLIGMDTSAPWWTQAMENYPEWWKMAGFTSRRGTNTILNGAWGRGALPVPPPGGRTSIGARTSMFGQRLKMRYNPRSAISYSHMERMAPGGSKNWMGVGGVTSKNPNFRTGHSALQMGAMVNSAAIGAGTYIPGVSSSSWFKNLPQGQAIASSGFWSANNAAYAIGKQATLSPTRAANLASYMKTANPAMYNAMGGAGFSYTGPGGPMAWGSATQNMTGMSGNSASQLLRGTAHASWNQFMGGAFAAARTGLADDAARGIATAAGKPFMSTMFARGAAWQAQGLAHGGFMMGEKMGVKGFFQGAVRAAAGTGVEMAASKYAAQTGMSVVGREIAETAVKKAAAEGAEALARHGAKRVAVGMAAKFVGRAAITAASGPAAAVVGPVMAAWTAYDLVKTGVPLATAAVRGAVNFEKDMAISLQGSINKAPMSGYRGLGYNDTEVAMTSRQRGVQAIQNSRLNARSVLGSESALMAGHFS